MRSLHSPPLDEEGRFALRDLPAGTYRVQVGGQDYLRKPPQPLPLAEGQAVTDFVLEISPVQVLSGRLLAPDGTPVANQEADFQAYVQWEENYAHWEGTIG